MAAPLTTLDGRDLGAIQVLAGAADAFSDVDEAVLVHLAQMVSAAIDRLERYGDVEP
jgi:GAF domain-containing protein